MDLPGGYDGSPKVSHRVNHAFHFLSEAAVTDRREIFFWESAQSVVGSPIGVRSTDTVHSSSNSSSSIGGSSGSSV